MPSKNNNNNKNNDDNSDNNSNSNRTNTGNTSKQCQVPWTSRKQSFSISTCQLHKWGEEDIKEEQLPPGLDLGQGQEISCSEASAVGLLPELWTAPYANQVMS